MRIGGSGTRAWLAAALGAVALPSLFADCATRGTAAARWDGAMRDSSGVALVENYGAPMWGDDGGWRFTRTLRIGVAEGDSSYMIGGPGGMVILSDGRVVLGDALYHNVRFFSPKGKHLRTLGKQGQGPGEYAGFINLLLGAGDTVLAIDQANGRANVIAPDGESLESFPTIPSHGFYVAYWDDDETTRDIVSLMQPLRGEGAPDETRFDLLIRRDVHGAFLDTLARLPTSEFLTGSGESTQGHFYGGVPDFDLCDGFVVTGHNDEFRLV